MTEITMHPVKSSQIKRIGHDAATNTLVVEFSKGGLYHYSGVTPEQFQDLRAADSVGKHLGQHINGKHEFKRI